MRGQLATRGSTTRRGYAVAASRNTSTTHVCQGDPFYADTPALAVLIGGKLGALGADLQLFEFDDITRPFWETTSKVEHNSRRQTAAGAREIPCCLR